MLNAIYISYMDHEEGSQIKIFTLVTSFMGRKGGLCYLQWSHRSWGKVGAVIGKEIGDAFE